MWHRTGLHYASDDWQAEWSEVQSCRCRVESENHWIVCAWVRVRTLCRRTFFFIYIRFSPQSRLIVWVRMEAAVAHALVERSSDVMTRIWQSRNHDKRHSTCRDTFQLATRQQWHRTKSQQMLSTIVVTLLKCSAMCLTCHIVSSPTKYICVYFIVREFTWSACNKYINSKQQAANGKMEIKCLIPFRCLFRHFRAFVAADEWVPSVLALQIDRFPFWHW